MAVLEAGATRVGTGVAELSVPKVGPAEVDVEALVPLRLAPLARPGAGTQGGGTNGAL